MSVRMSGAGAALEADTKSRTAKSRASYFMTRERERDGGGREERRCTRGIASCLQLPVALSCCCFYRLNRRSLAGHSHPGSLGSRVPHSRRRLHKQQPLARVTRLCGPEPGFWAAIAVSLLRPSFSCSRPLRKLLSALIPCSHAQHSPAAAAAYPQSASLVVSSLLLLPSS